MFARIAFVGMAVVAAALAPVHLRADSGEPVRLSVVSPLPEAHTARAVFEDRFQEEISRRLGEAGAGEVIWEGFHERTLARHGGTLEAVEDQLAMFGIIAVNHETERLPLQHLTFRMPFTTEDCVIVAKAYRHVHEHVEGMGADAEAARQILLAGIASDGYNIIATQKIRNAGEIRGINIALTDRVEDWIVGVNGVPVRILADVIGMRIMDGTVAGALLPTTEIGRLGLKLDANHFTRTGFGAQVSFAVTVNTLLVEGLPEPVREAVRATLPDFVESAASDYCAAGDAAVAHLRAHGASTAKLLKSRRYQWAETLPPLATDWAREHDAAGRPASEAVAMFMAQLREAGVTLTRDWSAVSATGTVGGPEIGAEVQPEPEDAHRTDG
jgi:TRAP-type C4-dicarboxylate transport system substrate-binding protein